MLMPDQAGELWPQVWAVLFELWPGLVGALFAMRFQPAETSLMDRAYGGASSVLLSGVFGPALSEVFGIDQPASQIAVSVLVGIFGLIVIGEAVKAVREVGLATFMRDWLRRIFGVGGGGS